METEVFFIIDAPGWDRRFVERRMTPERYEKLKADTPGTRIFRVEVLIPPREEGKSFDGHAQSSPANEIKTVTEL